MSEICQSGSCGAMKFKILPSGCIRCNACVLWNSDTRDAIIIDPTDDAAQVIDFARSEDLRVHQILLTHGHFDHAADAERAMREFTCPAFLHADDLPLYVEIPHYAPRFGTKVGPRTMPLSQVRDQQRISVFADFEIQVMHVPGHSAGSVAFYLPQAGWAFVGDTLFYSGVGRTDLPGGSTKKLIASIQNVLYALPDDTIAIPGHGSTTTVGREKRLNPHVRAARVEPSP